MSAARRSLFTATAAGTLLAALWFVPNATATPEHTSDTTSTVSTTSTDRSQVSTAVDTQSEQQLRLADTGTFDTTPYVVGGSAFLGLGVGFVAYSVRRGRSLEAPI
ncbi:hypothetical protein OKJ48_28295 [Streptomyces kunmingensis]|uniref:LPXTG cell wall anchor domain-containing protein n=1 Tax=Streptomyces kunmingensis TaxID=68225 RepID=A0ABU6CIA3_9ACTN|nr:hypothetical protein [Streptomyces kunmingensis]MEB3964110.1 hypothetical protein [Streptomyces kunmingensis]